MKAPAQRLIYISLWCKSSFCDQSDYLSPGKPCLASLGQFMLVLLPATDKDTREAIELSTGFSRLHRTSREFSSFHSQRLRWVVFLSSRSNQYPAPGNQYLKSADQPNPWHLIFSFQRALSRLLMTSNLFSLADRKPVVILRCKIAVAQVTPYW